jgi:hypothetical protein
VVDLVFGLERLDRLQELLRAAEGAPIETAWLDAARAYASGALEQAAALFARIGSRPDEALTRLRVAKAFAEAGRDADARRELEHAVDFFEAVGASAYLREAVLVA